MSTHDICFLGEIRKLLYRNHSYLEQWVSALILDYVVLLYSSSLHRAFIITPPSSPYDFIDVESDVKCQIIQIIVRKMCTQF